MIPLSKRSRGMVLAICAGLLMAGVGVFAFTSIQNTSENRISVLVSPSPTNFPTPTLLPTATATPSPVPDIVVHDVPFTVQAPRQQWEQDIYQYACEEASILMAMGWVTDRKVITPDEAEQEITDMALFAADFIGTFYDESAADTLRLFQAYYEYDQLELYENVTAEAVKNILYAGNIAILPMNGQILKNPNYTPPGPVEHMLVVIGYDKTTDEFITNDPGISQGRHWRYDAQLFEAAVQDYPTGKQEPITAVHKRMIVVGK